MYSSNTYSTPTSHQSQQTYQNSFAQSSASSFNPNSSYQPFQSHAQGQSPFGSSQQSNSPFGQQSQYGGGYPGQAQGQPQAPPAFGQGAHGQQAGGQSEKKRYMLGYLSSGTMTQVSVPL